MKEELLKDPTVYHWRFFLRWHSREPKSHRQTHWETFKKALIDAIQWADLQQESVIPRYDTLPPAHQTNVRLASLPWALHPDGFTHSLESRVMLELFYLQSGCAQEGATGATAFSTLKEADWHWDDKSNSYLGDAVCLSTELTERIEKEDAREMTSSILTHWFGEPVQRVELVELSCGFLAKSVEVEDEVWVLLVWDEEQVQEQATHLVHRLMPPLVSARLKGREIIQRFFDDILDQTHKMEAELDGKLKGIATQPRRLKLLDPASDTIAQLQMAFAAQLNECEEMLKTVRVNAGNIERLLNDPLLADHRVILDELMAAPLRLSVEQIATDLDYLSATSTQAEKTLQSLRTTAEVHAGRWGRRMTILLGLFVAFELPQTFPGLPWWVRAILVVVGASVVSGFIWWVSRDE